MGHCAACGSEVTELGSNRCLGSGCEKRLCYRCFSETFGYCPRCKILDDAEREITKQGGCSFDEYLQMLDLLDDLEEPEKKAAEKVFKEDRILKRIKSKKDDSTEKYILKRIDEINRELEKPEEDEEEDEEED